MSSSSSSYHQNEEFNAFYGIEPSGKRWKVSESSRLFDVFINHRGPDVKHTLATQLYIYLERLGIRAFLDSQEKELGNSFPSIIKTAICSAKVHVAIFSKRYAESAWCLAELVQMLESKAKIIPVFYEVEPWELRHIERGCYAEAFNKYEEKGRYMEKLSEWKEALQSLSFIAGEEFHRINDCENIVAAVQREVQRKRCLHVANYPVGLNNLAEDFERRCLDELVQDFVSQCRLEERRHKPNVVGIFGMGGSGKTTLAKELFNRKRSNYSRASFLFDVREASVRSKLPSLQSQLLKDLFYEDLGFRSVEEGKSYLHDSLQSSPFLNCLIVVDDIDHMEQLDALLVMHILKKSTNSLVIVTTRDVGVVVTAGITVGYPLTGMDRNHGRELFCWHAFGQSHPCTGYKVLVDEFVEVCGGLPLSLQVLGRHVHGRDHSYWQSELTKARMALPQDVKQRLRISFESLDDEQKQVFMDTACFFVGKPKSIAESIWEGSGWNAQHALETLTDKFLVQQKDEFYRPNNQVEIVFRMHDHLRDLGREMAHELSPPHRLWRPQDLESLESMGFKAIITKTNVRCFNSIFYESMGAQVAFFLGQSDSCLQTSASILWLQIEGNSTELSSIPSWIPLQKLQCLIIKRGRFKTLWENDMQEDRNNGGMSSSVRTLLSGLKKLEIRGEECVSKILISVMHYPSLRSIKLHYLKKLVAVDLRMVKTLNCLALKNCKKLESVLGLSELEKLVELEISDCGKLEFESLCLRDMKCLERISFDRNVIVKCFELNGCQNLITAKFCCEKLVELRILGCPELKEMPDFTGPSCLEKIIIDQCGIQDLILYNFKNLKSVSEISNLAKLVELEIFDCGKLEFEYLCLRGMRCLERITFDRNVVVKCFQLDGCQNLITARFCCEKLVDLRILGCPVLKEIPAFIGSSCLERITFDRCGIQDLILYNCKNLKSVSGISELTKLVELRISQCGKLEFDHLCLKGMKCLDRIKFDRNVTVKCFEFDNCQNLKKVKFCCENIVEVRIRSCPELKEMPAFIGPNCLERIVIDECRIQDFTLHNCQNLKCVSGISDLTELVELKISGCGKLEFDYLCFREMNCLETIEFDRNVMVKCFGLDSCQNLKKLNFCYEKLVELRIRSCPELKKMPAFIATRCVERIIIDGCGIQDLMLYNCQNLKSVSASFQFRVLDIYNCPQLEELLLHIYDCPELEELPSVARPSSLWLIAINSCEKLENIAGIQELHVPEYMRLRYFSNAVIRNCIHKLKSVPSEGMDMIGRAVDGAESTLNKYMFCGAESSVDRVTEIGTEETHSILSELSAIIVCLVVVVDSSSSVEDLNKSLPGDYVYGLRVRQGEWIITMVTCDPFTYYHRLTEIQDVLTRKGIMKKGVRVEVKKGEEWKGIGLLCTIVDSLYH